MVIFIRDRDGGRQKALTCYEWDYHLDNGQNASFSVLGNLVDYDGGLIIVQSPEVGWRYAANITTIEPSEDGRYTKISARPMIDYLDRSVAWIYSTSDLGAAIEDLISDNWGAAQTDELYRATWLSVAIGDHGAFSAPKTDDTGLFNVKTWLHDLESSGRLYLMAMPTDEGVTLTDGADEDSQIQIFLGIGKNTLESESYSDTVVSKITLHTLVGETWTATDYYLFEDGTYSTNPALGTRLRGEWKHLVKKELVDVEAEFAKNMYEHKVVFTSDKLKRLGSPVALRMPNGNVLHSIISSIEINSGSNLIRYTAGRLKTTLSEFMEGIRNG